MTKADKSSSVDSSVLRWNWTTCDIIVSRSDLTCFIKDRDRCVEEETSAARVEHPFIFLWQSPWPSYASLSCSKCLSLSRLWNRWSNWQSRGGFTVPDSYTMQQHRLCKGSMEDSSAEKDLGIVLDKLKTEQQCMCIMKTTCCIIIGRMETAGWGLCPELASLHKKHVAHGESTVVSPRWVLEKWCRRRDQSDWICSVCRREHSGVILVLSSDI